MFYSECNLATLNKQPISHVRCRCSRVLLWDSEAITSSKKKSTSRSWLLNISKSGKNVRSGMCIMYLPTNMKIVCNLLPLEIKCQLAATEYCSFQEWSFAAKMRLRQTICRCSKSRAARGKNVPAIKKVRWKNNLTKTEKTNWWKKRLLKNKWSTVLAQVSGWATTDTSPKRKGAMPSNDQRYRLPWPCC